MFSTRAYHMFTINKIIVHAVKHLQQVCQDSQKLLECHKTFRRELSGEMRSTPNVTNEVLNNAELMDSTKEQGVTWEVEKNLKNWKWKNYIGFYNKCWVVSIKHTSIFFNKYLVPGNCLFGKHREFVFFSSFCETLSSSIADFFVSFYGMNGQRLNQECLIENTKICVNGTSNVV